MSDSAQKPVDRIDVYVDGGWLYPGKANPSAKGGWGAVVIESHNNEELVRWHASGGLPETAYSTAAELIAVCRGLEAVKARQEYRADGIDEPEIILHTDQRNLSDIIAKTLSNQNTAIAPIIKQIVQLMGKNVQIVYTQAAKEGTKSKTNEGELMDRAHHLATAEANKARFAEQGFIARGIQNPSDQDEFARKVIKTHFDRGWRDETNER